MENKVTKDMTMGEILRQYPECASTLLKVACIVWDVLLLRWNLYKMLALFII